MQGAFWGNPAWEKGWWFSHYEHSHFDTNPSFLFKGMLPFFPHTQERLVPRGKECCKPPVHSARRPWLLWWNIEDDVTLVRGNTKSRLPASQEPPMLCGVVCMLCGVVWCGVMLLCTPKG